jgi:hypothetical protein
MLRLLRTMPGWLICRVGDPHLFGRPGEVGLKVRDHRIDLQVLEDPLDPLEDLGEGKKVFDVLPKSLPIENAVLILEKSLVRDRHYGVFHLFGEKELPGRIRGKDHQLVILLEEGDEIHQPGGVAKALTVTGQSDFHNPIEKNQCLTFVKEW